MALRTQSSSSLNTLAQKNRQASRAGAGVSVPGTGFRSAARALLRKNAARLQTSRHSTVCIESVFSPERPPVRGGEIRTSVDLTNVQKQQADAEINTPGVNQVGLNGLAKGNLEGLVKGEFVVSASQPIEYVVKEVQGMLDFDNHTLLSDLVPDQFPYKLMPHNPEAGTKRRCVVIDTTINELYGEQIQKYMEHNNVLCNIIVLEAGEAHKNMDQVFHVAERIEDWGVNRRTEPIIAIGGGVLMDIAALAANLFRRNTPIIKVPTTLMGVVDASIGVKTGVNFHQHKNKLGTYCAPIAAFYDLKFLETLDRRNVSNGMAEIVKMACVKDEVLFNLLEQHGASLLDRNFQGTRESNAIDSMVVRRSIQGMLEELEPNLWEHFLVRIVDYGHTASTRIEMDALDHDEPLLHGEAVAIDMAMTTAMSYARGLITESQRDRTFKMFRDLELDVWHPSATPEAAWRAVEDMTKARDGFQRMPLMRGVGAAKFVNDVTFKELEEALDYCKGVHLEETATVPALA